MLLAMELLKLKEPTSWEDPAFISTFVLAETSSTDSNTKNSLKDFLVYTPGGVAYPHIPDMYS